MNDQTAIVKEISLRDLEQRMEFSCCVVEPDCNTNPVECYEN